MIFQNCPKLHSPNGSLNYVYQFRDITRGIYTKYHYKSCYYLHILSTTRKRIVFFICGCFKLSWNITALSQSNCRHFSCSSIKPVTNEVDWIAPCKENQDSLGFWTPRSGFRIPGSRFWILCQWKLDSGFQSLMR